MGRAPPPSEALRSSHWGDSFRFQPPVSFWPSSHPVSPPAWCDVSPHPQHSHARPCLQLRSCSSSLGGLPWNLLFNNSALTAGAGRPAQLTLGSVCLNLMRPPVRGVFPKVAINSTVPHSLGWLNPQVWNLGYRRSRDAEGPSRGGLMRSHTRIFCCAGGWCPHPCVIQGSAACYY